MMSERGNLAAFTPIGVLRASINLGNPNLANNDPRTRETFGVSVDLAGAFAQRLGVALERVVFDSAGKSAQAVTDEQADVGFFAVDPLRGEGIAFTAPYVLIEGCYLVRDESAISSNNEVDRVGQTVVVGKGSAYDIFLTHELRQATILRAGTSPSVADTLVAQKADVAAGIRQQLEADAKRLDGMRWLAGCFIVIQQAMGTPKGRGPAAAAFLSAFVEEMKQSGFVAEALARHRIQGATVAPPAMVTL